MMKRTLLGLFLLWSSIQATAEDQQGMTVEEFTASLRYQQGSIDLPGGKASLRLSSAFRYLDPDDSRRVLEDAWGNPDGTGTLGMLVPTDVSVLDGDGWAVVITYDEDGHVLDEDADAIDYDDLLGDMQDEVADASEVRVREGFDAFALVGWAEPPRYDKATKKMYWAKELKFGASEVNTLNYNVRVLGREGVLVLNAVATMDQLAHVRDRMGEVTAFSNFTAGDRYEDYDPDKDHVAAYGLAALVGGALAAKTGLLAKLGALLLAGKKLIVLLFVVVGGILARLFKRKT